jgi:hypothetical protein
MLRYCPIAVILLLTYHCIGQKVTVSKEVSVRNDVGYEIFGDISDHILLLRDEGTNYTVEVFDSELKYKLSREIQLDDRRDLLLTNLRDDTSFTMLYTHKLAEGDEIRMRRYDYKADLIDSTALDTLVRRPGLDGLRVTVSEDQGKVCFFAREKREVLHLHVHDATVDSLPLLWKKTIYFKDYNLRRDFRKILVTDAGEVIVIVESDDDVKPEHHLSVALVGQVNDFYTKIYYDRVFSVGLEAKYDNRNDRLLILGLYNDQNKEHADGYYFYNRALSNMGSGDGTFAQVPFGLDFIAEVYGKRVGRIKQLEYFSLKDVLIREDGGFAFFAEMNKTYSRRSAFGATQFGANSYGRGWTDYYNEDLVSIAVHPDGEEHWRTILYKKQFSQDDRGMYSSYCLFKTPSRLKILYNDEIKKNNTVSAYVMDPLGQYNRRSVLSTEYQKLKLRFRDAIQISNTALLVPSEKSLDLSLVKIDWGV